MMPVSPKGEAEEARLVACCRCDGDGRSTVKRKGRKAGGLDCLFSSLLEFDELTNTEMERERTGGPVSELADVPHENAAKTDCLGLYVHPSPLVRSTDIRSFCM